MLCLLGLQLAISGGAISGSTQVLPGQQPNEAIEIQTEVVASPINMVSTAIALAVSVGMLIVAVGLFRLARWGWLGVLVVSAALIVLILLQLLSGQGFSGSGVIQLLVFVAIFLLFLLDSGIKSLLWTHQEPTEPEPEDAE